MYDDDVDFYSLPDRKKRPLINSKRVATTDGLLSELPENNPPVRVFEKPLDQLVLDRLEHGQYTQSGLAEYFGVSQIDIRGIVNRYRRRGSDEFTRENFKQHLLMDRHGIIRAVDSDGKSFYYSLETIPFSARAVDPTLGFSLLDLNHHLADFPRLVRNIPVGEATELDEDYAFVVGEYWGIDPEEVFEYLTKHVREYIDTSLIPLPRIESWEDREQVADRFRQVDGVYERFRTTGEDVDNVAKDFLERAERGGAGIAAYQIMSIDMADLKWYTEYSDDYALQRRIDELIGQIADSLHPENRVDQEGNPPEELNLEAQVQLVISDTPQSAAEIFEEMPRDVQVGFELEEVVEELDHLAKIGTINKDTSTSPHIYYSGSDYLP